MTKKSKNRPDETPSSGIQNQMQQSCVRTYGCFRKEPPIAGVYPVVGGFSIGKVKNRRVTATLSVPDKNLIWV